MPGHVNKRLMRFDWDIFRLKILFDLGDVNNELLRTVETAKQSIQSINYKLHELGKVSVVWLVGLSSSDFLSVLSNIGSLLVI